MKVLHVISSLNLSSGGPSQSTISLVNGLRQQGIESEILTYLPQAIQDKMISEEQFIHGIQSPGNTRIGYSNKFREFLMNNSYDLYHGHALWQYPVHGMAINARKEGKPYIITTRGMLYPEGLKKSKWIKIISMNLYQRNDLKSASVLHATCKQELEIIRQNGFTNPIAVIPNSVDISDYSQIIKHSSIKRKIGFIGRFAPIKNIENLIQAWAISARSLNDWELILIGNGEPTYTQSLKNLSVKLGIKNIRFTGFLTGITKDDVVSELDYIILPSKSENFGMVVPEALLKGIPVIASKGTPWEELNIRNAGWWIETGVKHLAQALDQAMILSVSERQQMGENGRRLVEENYAIKPVSQKMVQLYKWILNGGKKPEFVYLNV